MIEKLTEIIACEIIATTPDPRSGKSPGLFLTPEGDPDDAPDEDFGAQVQCPKCKWSNNTMFGRYACVKCGTELPKPEAGVGQTNEAWMQQSHQAGPGGDGKVLGMKPLPLGSPFAKEMAFEEGRVACELIGVEKQIDFQTYQEVIVFGIDIRFRDEVDHNLEIGWIVSHRLEKFKALYAELADANGPLVASSRKKVPLLAEDLKQDDPNCLKRLEDWLTALFKLVPAGGKQTNLVYFDDDDDDAVEVAPPSEKPPHMLPSAWRSVRDPESGDLYYFNKITGETRWENPFEADEDLPPKPKFKLLPDWEAVFDKESGEYYYWNVKTQETTWEKPVAKNASKPRKLLEAKDLLHVQCVNRFLDLKRNVQRMEELALS
jgi:hypothetical protein